MTESDDNDEARTTLRAPRKLELKKTVGSGQVRQSFSRGRTKPVTVEVRKKRTIARGGSGPSTEVKSKKSLKESVEAFPEEIREEPGPLKTKRPQGVVLKSLTDDEKAARAKGLDGARQRDEDVRRQAAEDASRKRRESEKLAEEKEAAEHRKKNEESRKRVEEEARLKAEATAAKKLVEPESLDERAESVGKSKKEGQRRGSGRRQEDKRRERFNIDKELSGEERTRSLASVRRARERERKSSIGNTSENQSPKKVFRDVTIPEMITVQELANRMSERAVDVVKILMRMGVMATPLADIDADTAELVVSEFGHRVKRVSESDVEIGIDKGEDHPDLLVSRAPVVTVMGHVDHGKTSLLDALRKTDVAKGEAGGITQHIGAYQVKTATGGKITFLDTPGHEAFTAMRARGANVTDIVILVVAADDGIMPQTVEAIRHAQEAKVPIIVAVNKIDLPGANPRKVRESLLQHDLVVEEMGGEVLAIDVSAKEKTNLDKLEEAILLQAELLELKANPNRSAEGFIVEAKIDIGRGPLATVLVNRGTLKVGEVFVAGGEWGRVRAMLDIRGEKVEQAEPSIAVEVLGLNGAPEAGENFFVVDSESRAREIAAFRQRRTRVLKAGDVGQSSMEEMFSRIQEGDIAEFPVLVKADVRGSVEAITASAMKLNTEEVSIRIIHSGAGGINESDIGLARASSALVIGFNVRANAQARDLANRENVNIRYYSVIYDLIEDFKGILSGMLSPTIKENALGNAEVLEVFSISKAGKIAGCRVTDGIMRRGAKVRLLRDDVVIHEGALSNLKRFKDDVDEVKSGIECGLALEKYQDIQSGDIIEAFELEEIARTI